MANPLSPEQAVNLIEKLAGAKPGYRRAHARGLVVQGSFTASQESRTLSIAEHLQGGPVPCLVRFSNASGNPCAPDRGSATEGKVLGMAIRFVPASGKAATWAAINIPAFPARTPEEFLALSAAQVPGAGGKPNMLRLLWHILKHLHILASVKGIKALRPSGSFALETYHGLHTYFLVDAKGGRRPFRYHWLPVPGNSLPGGQGPGGQGPGGQGPGGQGPGGPVTVKGPAQYLLSEIRQRLEKGTAAWDLVAQFPQADDPLDDPSVQWPEGRERSVLGRLTLDRVHADQRATESLVFDPTGVVPGIELSDDPILRFRPLAYGVSFDRRSREKRDGPAPADMGQ